MPGMRPAGGPVAPGDLKPKSTLTPRRRVAGFFIGTYNMFGPPAALAVRFHVFSEIR